MANANFPKALLDKFDYELIIGIGLLQKKSMGDIIREITGDHFKLKPAGGSMLIEGHGPLGCLIHTAKGTVKHTYEGMEKDFMYMLADSELRRWLAQHELDGTRDQLKEAELKIAALQAPK